MMPAVIDESRVAVPLDAAAHVADVPAARVRRWEQRSLIVPRTRREISPRRTVRLYTFDELVEMRLIRALEEHGAHIMLIRKLIELVRGHGRRVQLMRWAVAQGEPLVELDGTWHGGRRPSQGVIIATLDIDELRAEVRARLARGKDQYGREEHRPGVLGSKAVFAGTRTPVAALTEYLNRGISDSEILEAFPHLTVADIEFAREKLGS